MRFLGLALILVTGCFNPKFKDQLACGANGECPPGRTCGTDNFCHEDNSSGDASLIDAVPDAPPDAPPVECSGDPDCQQPPDMCTVAGVCDQATHKCIFQPRDCSSVADTCNDAGCLPQMGCVKVPAHQGVACGAGNQCPAFGACGGFADTCDSSGTQSRTCTMFTCQAGQCMGTSYNDSQACTRATNGVSCGTTTVSNCGACMNSSQSGCAADGNQVCTCTDRVCQSDACTATSSSCTRQTNCKTIIAGDVCGITSAGCPTGSIRDKCCTTTGACTALCGACEVL